jgi:EAL domain-containing protein (putative c-di-GMP-specific phosphodiesterase class I)
LSVDDAGSGYACLTHVLALRPAFVKLDRGWVQDIEADPVRQALVAGLQHFAQRAGCRLIAEGIETTAQLETLRGLDVEFGQGFLLGPPQPAPGEQLAQSAAR